MRGVQALNVGNLSKWAGVTLDEVEIDSRFPTSTNTHSSERGDHA
jgi:hypothetical protein